MLAIGDELGRSQGGNNNAYAQDNPTTWLDWAAADQDLIAFTVRLIALRRAMPLLRDERRLSGEPGAGGVPDVAWFRPDGARLTPADWENDDSLLMLLAGDGERVG